MIEIHICPVLMRTVTFIDGNCTEKCEEDSPIEVSRKELEDLTDEKEIEARFYRNLEFGTGGLRSIIGAGTNRMNKYTVGKTTTGLARYLLNTYGDEAKNRCVAIGYDTRNNSEPFARVTADVLSAFGIRVYLHAHARPVPQLSSAVTF